MDPKVKSVFDEVSVACARSFTKKDLHSNPLNEEILAQQLDGVFFTYGRSVAGQFQAEYAEKNPALSFLFAQVSNAVVETAFHHESCHAQAALALIKLLQEGVYNVSLMWSRTDDPSTEHHYLLVLDGPTVSRLKKVPAGVYVVVNSRTGLPPDSLFLIRGQIRYVAIRIFVLITNVQS